MESLTAWIVELNKTNQIGFAALTVATMSGIGIAIALTIELLFKALGIKSDKIKIQH